MSSLHQGFQATDQSSGPEVIFGWLDRMNASPLILQVKQQMLEVRPVGEGDQILDVGCGLGHEVFRLAELVGRPGRTTGIDANSAMISEARRRAAGLTSRSPSKSATLAMSISRTTLSIFAAPSVSCAIWTGRRRCWER